MTESLEDSSEGSSDCEGSLNLSHVVCLAWMQAHPIRTLTVCLLNKGKSVVMGQTIVADKN